MPGSSRIESMINASFFDYVRTVDLKKKYSPRIIQMCSLLNFIAGLNVLFYGMLLITHQNSFAPDPLTDASILEVLLVSYKLCYIILSTSLEPLRSAMKTVYVCFAEHPLSVSQTFPLIYQRLRRITEINHVNI